MEYWISFGDGGSSNYRVMDGPEHFKPNIAQHSQKSQILTNELPNVSSKQ